LKIQDLLQKNCILIDLKGTDTTEVLTLMARYMCSLFNLPEPDSIVRKILERESEMSTGIGYGIAIPHARITAIDRLYMIAARSTAGIEFNAIDEQPVHLLFMMISPASTSTEHTQILSSLSRIMSYEDMREKLMEAQTPDVFLDTLIKGENKYVE
jgi:mannitol/fructose-specific phosphotransferase system IIA component (Ntr-type)